MDDHTMQRLAAANPISAAPEPRAANDLLDAWARDGLLDTTTEARRSWSERVMTWLVSGVLIAVVGTASAAAALTALTGSPLPSSADTYAVSPKPGTTRVSEVRAADPDGGPPWAVRVGTAEAGLICLGVGQIQGGTLGLVGLDGVFREVPPAGADDCGAPPTADRSTVQTRTFLGEPRAHRVTVIYGLRATAGSSVRVRYADGVTKVLPVGRDGSFIVARRGGLSAQHPRVEIGLPKRKLSTVDLAPSSAAPYRWKPERSLVPSEAPR